MGLFRARLIVKGWEPSRSTAENKVILGYLKCYDVDSKTDFSLGTTFAMDDATIDRSPQYYDIELGLKDAFGKLNGTCFQLQVVQPNGRTKEAT